MSIDRDRLTAPATASIARLKDAGYKLTNVYGDGLARCERAGFGVWVEADGRVTKPHTMDTLREAARLRATFDIKTS